jgi:hypothetical protein
MLRAAGLVLLLISSAAMAATKAASWYVELDLASDEPRKLTNDVKVSSNALDASVLCTSKTKDNVILVQIWATDTGDLRLNIPLTRSYTYSKYGSEVTFFAANQPIYFRFEPNKEYVASVRAAFQEGGQCNLAIFGETAR